MKIVTMKMEGKNKKEDEVPIKDEDGKIVEDLKMKASPASNRAAVGERRPRGA